MQKFEKIKMKTTPKHTPSIQNYSINPHTLRFEPDTPRINYGSVITISLSPSQMKSPPKSVKLSLGPQSDNILTEFSSEATQKSSSEGELRWKVEIREYYISKFLLEINEKSKAIKKELKIIVYPVFAPMFSSAVHTKQPIRMLTILPHYLPENGPQISKFFEK